MNHDRGKAGNNAFLSELVCMTFCWVFLASEIAERDAKLDLKKVV